MKEIIQYRLFCTSLLQWLKLPKLVGEKFQVLNKSTLSMEAKLGNLQWLEDFTIPAISHNMQRLNLEREMQMVCVAQHPF